MDSIPTHIKKEVTEFFNTYKNLEGEDIWTRVHGWQDKKAAYKRIEQCRSRWFSVGLRMETLDERNELLEKRLVAMEGKSRALEDRLLKLEGKST